MLNEIGQHVGPIDEEETDEELASIHRQWEREESSLLPAQDETIEEPEPRQLLEEAPKFIEETQNFEQLLPEEEAPLSEDRVAEVEEELVQSEKETDQLQEDVPESKEDIQQELEELNFEVVGDLLFTW